ncbi:hypothetical protein LCGC14_2876060 [marine sediment metagenome]|uniref:Uncharacterized protein n=1 Tax=marine sediment metagenome TaxID=412755 RepID=A0A0F8Y1F9_9ZZZZ
MEITKELLEKRLEVLTVQKAQFVANVNACEGGIITVRGLLSDLDREDVEDNGERAEGESAPQED